MTKKPARSKSKEFPPNIDWEYVLRDLDLTSTAVTRSLVHTLREVAAARGDTPPVLDHQHEEKIAQEIIRVEQFNKGKEPEDILNGFARDSKFSTGPKRLRLHASIVESLFSKVRPLNEEHISITKGGALPRSGIKSQNRAFFVIGPPASGKSHIANPLAEGTHSMIIDPDDAKRMLPEYRSGLNALALHEESSQIIKGPNGLYREALANGFNIVVPTIGAEHKKLMKLLDEARTPDSALAGYQLFLVHVDCPVEVAAYRSVERLLKHGRYVPLRYLLGVVGNKPKHAYIKARKDARWAGYASYSTVMRGAPPKLGENQSWDFSI